MIVSNTDIKREDIIYERSNTWISPDSGTTSGSRQTLITGEACRRACEKLMEDKKAGLSVEDMIGKVYYAEYLAKTDPLGANVPNRYPMLLMDMLPRFVFWIPRQVKLKR